MKTKVIKGLVTGDWHVGSAFGLFPDDFTLSTGARVRLNTGQKYLLDCYHKMLARLPKRLDFVIFNGDLVDGLARKVEGRWRVEPDPDFQVKAALELAQPIARRARAVYVTRGTPYHSGSGSSGDELFAREIGAVQDPMGHYAWSWIPALDVGGIRLDIAHHRSVFMRYEASVGEREIQFDKIVAEIKGSPSDLIIRSHGHRFFFLNMEGSLFVAVPAFELQTDFAKMSKFPNRYLARLVGAVLLKLYPHKKTGGIQDATEFVKVESLTWPHPPLGVAYLEDNNEQDRA